MAGNAPPGGLQFCRASDCCACGVEGFRQPAHHLFAPAGAGFAQHEVAADLRVLRREPRSREVTLEDEGDPIELALRHSGISYDLVNLHVGDPTPVLEACSEMRPFAALTGLILVLAAAPALAQNVGQIAHARGGASCPR